MSQLRYLFLACSITFFACSEVTGTWEDENTFAQQSSSSAAESSAESSSGTTITSSESEILWIDSIQTDVYSGCVSNLKLTYIGEAIVIPDSNESKPAAVKSTSTTSTIVLSKFIEGRVVKLIASGIPESEADSIAQWELFKAIGIDTYLRANTDVSPTAINSAINYIFGGTTDSDFYKNANAAFTETGTLQPEHYCNFDESSVLGSINPAYNSKSSITYYNRLYAKYILYKDSGFRLKGCSGSTHLIIPSDIVNNIQQQCLNLPHCDSTIKDTIIKSNYKNLGKRGFICKENGWKMATDLESETYGIPCDKEGKYIVHSKQPEYSYMCSLDSGWHAVYTIDAETFDVPCDSAGKLYASPNRPNVTYICQKSHNSATSVVSIVSVCKVYPINPDPYSPSAPCRKEGWEIAKLIEVETANVECDTEGKTYQSLSDTNLYYVCHDKNWTEFYNMPCDTDNMRVKIINDSLKTNFSEYICFNKKWKRTYKLDYDYPKDYYFNPNFEYGEFEDPRDGQIYKTTEFKGKTWMAENIKYEGVPVTDSTTACLADSCKNVGRFYNASIAGEICPEGWRLPDSADIASFGKNPEDLEKLYSQLEGVGIINIYTAPDTYGMSFKEIGRICETNSYKDFSQEYATRLWLNEIDSEGNRRYATITTESVKIDWYKGPAFIEDSTGTRRIQPPNDNGDTYRTIRCIKK